MIERSKELGALRSLISRHHVVAILGARQVGKATLARAYAKTRKGDVTFFDLEDPGDLARLADPMLALSGLRGLIVIDEIQRAPDLFTVLRVLADRPGTSVRFLVLGSASPELLRQSSESLAGRIAYHSLAGFSLDETGFDSWQRLWLRGGFPRSYLARSHSASDEWRREFIQTFLERDLPQLGISIRSATLRRFWNMLAHYHGQLWNSSELARAFGVADTTVRHYLDLLCYALVVQQLPPWHENISKRQVRAPKVYIADCGLLHTLLGLATSSELEGHPKVGASWEGFVLNEVIRRLGARRQECFFWATHGGAELDLLVVRGSTRLGVEIKRTSSPRFTPSMRSALADLSLGKLLVIHAGKDSFPLARKVRAVAFTDLFGEVKTLR